MKRFWNILALAAALFVLAGCGISRIGQIEVTSVGIKYVVPTSTKSVDTKLRLGIYNPSVNFTVSDVEGTVKYHGEDFGYLTAGRIDVERTARKCTTFPAPPPWRIRCRSWMWPNWASRAPWKGLRRT